jgi:putative peptidoglycan lipid II flippase
LSIGTTLGVVVLSLSLLIPLRRTGVRLRPTLSFPPGIAPRVRRLAYAGAGALAAQDVATGVALRLANAQGTVGAALLFTLAWTVFLLPWAVLAVPIATSAFPTLTAHYDAGAETEFSSTAAATTRAVLLVSAVAAAAVAATADPVARVLIYGAHGASNPAFLSRAIALAAPGIIGYAFVAHLGRTLYSRGNGGAPAFATVFGWIVAVVADIALVAAVPATWTVGALAAGTSIGMTVAGVLLVVAVGRATSGAALQGLPRSAAAALVGGGAAYALGRLVVVSLHPVRAVPSLGVGLLAGAVVLVVFATILLAVDGGDLRALARRLRRSAAPAEVPSG